MGLDFRLMWRVGLAGAGVRAVLSLVERMLLSYAVDRVVSLALGAAVALLTGTYFTYRHPRQELLPLLVGGALAGILAIVAGLSLAYRLSFRWLGPAGDGPAVVAVAALAGALGGLAMRRVRRERGA